MSNTTQILRDTAPIVSYFQNKEIIRKHNEVKDSSLRLQEIQSKSDRKLQEIAVLQRKHTLLQSETNNKLGSIAKAQTKIFEQELRQTALLESQLNEIRKANDINSLNTLLLQAQNELHLIESEAKKEEINAQRLAKNTIYEIKREMESPNYKSDVETYLKLYSLKNIISNYTSALFSDFSDKEYRDNVADKIEEKIDMIVRENTSMDFSVINDLMETYNQLLAIVGQKPETSIKERVERCSAIAEMLNENLDSPQKISSDELSQLESLIKERG